MLFRIPGRYHPSILAYATSAMPLKYHDEGVA